MKLSLAGAPALCVWAGLAIGGQVYGQSMSTLSPPSDAQAYGSGLEPGARYWNYQANASNHFAAEAESAGAAVGQAAADAVTPITEAEAQPMPEASPGYESYAPPVASSGCSNGGVGGGSIGSGCNGDYGVGGYGAGSVHTGSSNFAYGSGAGSCGGGVGAVGGSYSGTAYGGGGGHYLDASSYGLDTVARPSWFGGVYGLMLDHDDDNRGTVYAYDDGNPFVPALSHGMGRLGASGGVETRFGYYLNQCSAIQAVYWGWYPGQKEANVFGADAVGNVNGALDFNDLIVNARPVNDYFTNSQRMRLQRRYEAHNVELNFLRLAGSSMSTARSRVALFGGVRYFQLDEDWRLSSDNVDATFDGNVNEVTYEHAVTNRLLGFQLGAMVDHYFTCRLSGQLGGSFGVYGNHMKIHSCIKNGLEGPASIATIGAGPYAGQQHVVDSDKNDVAYLGELRAGLGYDLNSCWRAVAGYRVVALSGVATAQSQIPHDFSDLASVADIDNHDSFILHGLYVGCEYNW